MPRTLTVYQPGVVGYEEAVAAQRRLADDFARTGVDAGALLLLEHPPVLTIGRSGTGKNILASREELERAGIRVFETNRGGDVTYHGPGQIVGYPVVPLAFHGKDVHVWLRGLESFLMAALWEYGIAADRRIGYTGVWTPQGKIASIGVAVSRWVAYHGFALNVAPNLEHFRLIYPCGLTDVAMTSMEQILGRRPDAAEVAERLIAHFRRQFHFDAVRRVVGRAPGGDLP